MEKKLKFILIFVFLLIIIIVLFNYTKLSKNIPKIPFIKSGEDQKNIKECNAPSCSPNDIRQYCLNNKWTNCAYDRTCNNGDCVINVLTNVMNCGYDGCSANGGKSGDGSSGGGGSGGGGGGEGSGGGGGSSNSSQGNNPQYVLTINKQGSGFGAITTEAENFNCDLQYAQCVLNYNQISQVTLTATPSAYSSTFDGWSGCETVSGNICIITVDSDKQVTATFNFTPEAH